MKQILDYIGETKTKKLVENIQKEYFELVRKTFCQKSNPIQNLQSSCLVMIHDQNETEIKGIGISSLNDLINDNFGVFFGAILSRSTFANLKQDTGVFRSTRIFGQSDTFGDTNGASGSHALGSQFAIGSGTTPPARGDFTVEGLIQAIFNPSGNAGYNSGLGQVSITGVSPVLIGSGSIGNAVMYGRWFSTNSTKLFVISHDLISPLGVGKGARIHSVPSNLIPSSRVGSGGVPANFFPKSLNKGLRNGFELNPISLTQRVRIFNSCDLSINKINNWRN